MHGTNRADEKASAANRYIQGSVIGCGQLLVHDKPDEASETVMLLSSGTPVLVDLQNSTDRFYKICNAAGIEGFCMKQPLSQPFVELYP